MFLCCWGNYRCIDEEDDSIWSSFQNNLVKRMGQGNKKIKKQDWSWVANSWSRIIQNFISTDLSCFTFWKRGSCSGSTILTSELVTRANAPPPNYLFRIRGTAESPLALWLNKAFRWFWSKLMVPNPDKPTVLTWSSYWTELASGLRVGSKAILLKRGLGWSKVQDQHASLGLKRP